MATVRSVERMEQTRAAPGEHNGQRRWLLPALAMPMAVFLTLPLLALVLRVDPVMFWQNVTNPTVVHAMTLSLTTGTIATGIVVVAGMPLAYLLARRQFRGRVVLDTFVDLPMILPPAVAGVALLLVFGRRGLLGPALETAGVPIVFTATAVVLAQVFVAAPYFIKSAAAGFAEVEQDLEQAAALDGASGFAVFRYVTVALAWPALLGGAVMTWARALGEFGATIIFAGNFPGRTQTMPLAIYLGFERDFDLAVTLAFILLGISFFVLMVVKVLLRNRAAV